MYKSGYRVSSTNCCVVGCRNTYSNTDKSIKFYRFPSKPHELERRHQWTNCVKRKLSPGNSDVWEPSMHSRICSIHFIGNAKSDHPKSPSYLPTIFPKSSRMKKIACKSKESKFQRLMKKQESQVKPNDLLAANFSLSCPSEESANMSDASVQVNFGLEDVSFVIDCYDEGSNEKGTFCNIAPTHNIKSKRKKCVDTTSEGSVQFHGISSIDNDEKLMKLTGVQFSVFNFLFSLLDKKSHRKDQISMKDKLLICFMKMKLGLSYSALGVLFGVHRYTAQKIFICILKELAQKTKKFIFWPSKEDVVKTLPKAFQINSDCRVIIDCNEVKIQQASGIENCLFSYSQYNSGETLKFLIGITPNGFISFLSKCYGGRASNSFITNDCGLLSLLEPNDVILADKGFLGVKCKKDIVFVMPPFLHDGHLTEEEVEKMYDVASVRIHVEKCIQRIKTYNLLHNITNGLLPYVDDIVQLCCVLTNLQTQTITSNIFH